MHLEVRVKGMGWVDVLDESLDNVEGIEYQEFSGDSIRFVPDSQLERVTMSKFPDAFRIRKKYSLYNLQRVDQIWEKMERQDNDYAVIILAYIAQKEGKDILWVTLNRPREYGRIVFYPETTAREVLIQHVLDWDFKEDELIHYLQVAELRDWFKEVYEATELSSGTYVLI